MSPKKIRWYRFLRKAGAVYRLYNKVVEFVEYVQRDRVTMETVHRFGRELNVIVKEIAG